MNKRSRRIITLCISALLLAGSYYLLKLAPGYLMYQEPPRKADCIIPLLGKEYIERKKEAYELISEGYSRVLLIPPRYRLVHVNDGNNRVPVPVKEELSELSILAYKEHPQYRWHENTHIELILAKQYMMAYGFTSAIVVSSPYHMRRVKLLSSYVFPEEQYTITCVPDRHARTASPWWSTREDFTWVTREYAKIAWLMIYYRFSELITFTSDLLSGLFGKR
ncbi:MAG TPA: ElyC/SanA/YdcF family protein [Deltaproteobacteria bacterium]|nr:ElyC/SanA/YdcF family protein [Deltaproteobacteria bacterium]